MKGSIAKNRGVSLTKPRQLCLSSLRCLPGGKVMANTEIDKLEEKAMAMKPQLLTLMLAACLTLAITSGSARADEVPLVTGEHWTQSSDQVKKAYIVGVANVLQVEAAYHGATPPSDTQSVVPRFVKGLKGGGHSLDTMREGLDKWYAANPDKMQRPVIEIIWFEMVMPGLQKSK